MPIFNDPSFPKPGELTKKAPASVPLHKTTTAMTKATTMPPGAVVAAPLKEISKITAVAPPEQMRAVIAPYNPYARKTETTRAFTMAGFELPELVLMGALSFAGLALMSTFLVQKMAEKQIKKALIKAVAPYEETAHITFGRVKVGLFKRSVQVRDIDVEMQSSGQTLHIDRAAVWGVDFDSLHLMALSKQPVLPETLKFSLEGVKMPVALLGGQAQATLATMGYTDVRASTAASLKFDRAHRTFEIENLNVTLPQIGRVDFSMALGNLTIPAGKALARYKKDPKLLLEDDLLKLTIKSFALSYKDDSFIQRALESIRGTNETSPIALVEMAIAINSGRSPTAVTNSDFVKPALETLHAFLENPSQISLEANPAKAIPLMSLLDERSGGSINEMAHRLNMSVE